MPAEPVAVVEQTTKDDFIWGIDFRRQIPDAVGIVSASILRIKRNTEEAPVAVTDSIQGSVVLFQTGLLTNATYTFEVVVTLSNGEDKESNMVLEVRDFLEDVGKATQTEKEDMFWGLDFAFAVPAGESISSFTLTRYLDGTPTDVSGDGSLNGTVVAWGTGMLTEGVYTYEAAVTLSNTEIATATAEITVVP